MRWLASWDWMDIPTWTMPQPSTITPTALMMEKIKSERLFTMDSGSPLAAKAGQVRAAQRVRVRTAVK